MGLEGPSTLRGALSPGLWDGTGLQSGIWETVSPRFQLQSIQIDLSGLSSAELTTFLSMVDIQRAGIYTSADPGTPLIQEWILITDTPWFNADIAAWIAAGLPMTPPGFIYATDVGTSEPLPSWVNVLYGTYNLFAQNNTVGNAMVKAYTTAWGSGGATASDTIYVYRICALTENPGTEKPITVPAINVVLGVVIAKEEDLPYIERLRRSYILQEGRDVD